MLAFIGLTMLIIGVEHFRKERTTKGWLFVVVLLFIFVSTEGFLLK
ncbi:DUF3953 domain-containing protein [Virgibacillus sp. 6R]